MAMKKRYQSVGGRIISEKSGGVRVDYLTDALGSVTCTVDQSQTASSPHRYAAYGKRVTASAPSQSFQWVGAWGYRRSSVSGLDYVRARHYRNESTAWITVDSLWPRTSAYDYCHSQPTNTIDATGLCSGQDQACYVCRDYIDLCAWAEAYLGDEVKNNLGYVACCWGREQACAIKEKWLYGDPEKWREVEHCVMLHEWHHKIDPYLFCVRSGYKDDCGLLGAADQDLKKSECNGYSAEVVCIASIVPMSCGGPDPSSGLCERLNDICSHLKHNCKGGGQPVYSEAISICESIGVVK